MLFTYYCNHIGFHKVLRKAYTNVCQFTCNDDIYILFNISNVIYFIIYIQSNIALTMLTVTGKLRGLAFIYSLFTIRRHMTHIFFVAKGHFTSLLE